eukprot:jgi/Mesvir1/17171/Mv07593-RA.1
MRWESSSRVVVADDDGEGKMSGRPVRAKSHTGPARSMLYFLHPAYLFRKPQRAAAVCIATVVFLYMLLENQTKTIEHKSQEKRIEELEAKIQMLQQQVSGEKKLIVETQGLAADEANLRNEVNHLEQLVEKQTEEAQRARLGKAPVFSPDDITHLEYMANTSDLLHPLGLSENDRRREAIVEAMRHSWDAYEKFAFGMDELMPQVGHGKNQFGGLGATIIDSLDTLWIMGLRNEFERAKQWVLNQMNVAPDMDLSVFETTIRCLGGLITAADLSGDRGFLNKAEDLAQHLLPAFDTPTGIPWNILNPHNGQGKNPGWTHLSSTLSEFGTEQLEFIGLSQRTGNNVYKDKVEHVIKYVRERDPGDGLFPLFMNPQSGSWTSRHVSFGAMGDSFFEYLLKVWIQGGRSPELDMYRDMWLKAMDNTLDALCRRSSPSNLLYICEREGSQLIHKMDHLACFFPGMLILGVYVRAPRSEEQALRYANAAQDLAHTCYLFYERQPSGLSAELYNFHEGNDFVAGAPHNLQRPETVETLFYMYRVTGNDTYREWGWRIFQAFQNHTRVPQGGYTGLRDVRQSNPVKDDTMQSFWLAETLKYFYLLFSSPDVMSLDEWVFNTEAHPLRVIPRSS